MADDLRDLLALHLITGIGPRLTAALLERFGSAGRALRASEAELLEVPYIGPHVAEGIARAAAGVDVATELGRVERHGVRLLALGTPDYPPQLVGIPDVPHLLYVRGELREADANAVADHLARLDGEADAGDGADFLVRRPCHRAGP